MKAEVMPPSRGKAAPVMKPASSLARYATVPARLRTEDSIGRWGGEEFLAVLPDTDAEGALVIAERLRAAKPGLGSADPRDAITVTIGAAAWQSGGMDDLISRADHALYAGKSAGRNNVQQSVANLIHTAVGP